MHAGDSRSTPSAEPNVIPMIDILLVLLIIFMVNIPRRSVFELQLPEEAPGEESTAEPQIVLEVRVDGSFAINQQEIGAAELRDTLRAIYAGRPRKVLFVKGDPRVTYQDVIAAIDLARSSGVDAIGIAPRELAHAP